MRQFQCFAVSDMNVDMIVEGNARPCFGQVEKLVDRFVLTIGGSANIFACQFAKLGGSIGLLGVVGEDAFGDLLRKELGAAGVDLSYVRSDGDLGTGVSIALVEGNDRAILTWNSTIDAIGPDDLKAELLEVADHWHIASYFLLTQLQNYWPSWLRRLRERGITASLDTNWAPAEDWAMVRELLPLVDVFLPNEAEAKAISGLDDVYAAGRALAALTPLVVIKCGENGSIAFRQGEVVEAHPPANIVKGIGDTVGAGDSFDAGFLRNWQQGKSLIECLRLGNACGAHSLNGYGGVTAQMRGTEP